MCLPTCSQPAKNRSRSNVDEHHDKFNPNYFFGTETPRGVLTSANQSDVVVVPPNERRTLPRIIQRRAHHRRVIPNRHISGFDDCFGISSIQFKRDSTVDSTCVNRQFDVMNSVLESSVSSRQPQKKSSLDKNKVCFNVFFFLFPPSSIKLQNGKKKKKQLSLLLLLHS